MIEPDFPAAGERPWGAKLNAALELMVEAINDAPDAADITTAIVTALTSYDIGVMSALSGKLDRASLSQLVSPMVANAYYTSIHTGTATTNNAEGALRGGRVVVGRACTLVQIGLDVTTAGSTGAVVRLGIYRMTSPTTATLLVDAGTIDATTTGLKFLTINQAVALGDNLMLVAVPQGGATTRPVVRANSGPDPYQGDATPATVNVNVLGGAGVTGVTAALPASPTLVAAGSGSIPRVIVRVAP